MTILKDPVMLDGVLCEYSDAVQPGVYRVAYPHPYQRYNVCTDYFTDRCRADIAAAALIMAGVTDRLDIDRLESNGLWIPVDRW